MDDEIVLHFFERDSQYEAELERLFDAFALSQTAQFYTPQNRQYTDNGVLKNNPTVNLERIKTIEFVSDRNTGSFEIQYKFLSGEMQRHIFDSNEDLVAEKKYLLPLAGVLLPDKRQHKMVQ